MAALRKSLTFFHCPGTQISLQTLKRYFVTTRPCPQSSKYADGPVHLYDLKVAEGELHEDDHQRQIMEELQSLHEALKSYTPSPAPGDGFFSKIFKKKPVRHKEDQAKKYSESPLGLYLFGSVGSGKTMLMDYFYHTCHVEKKQRVHFHQFMLEVHGRLHKVKQEMAPSGGYNLNRAVAYDPIPPVARDISQQSHVLCFDEFQVTDIADAMILKRLFSHLWQNGVVVIATSNRKPDDLYKNGLQRINFLPFIPMAKANFKVLSLDSGIDYRKQSLPAAGSTYFVSSECDSGYEMDRTYEDLVSRELGVEGARSLTILNRQVYLPKTCGRILDCTFREMCLQPLGAVDYLAMCEEFDTILIRDIPVMTLEDRSSARRFITLIDTLYDHKVRLVCSSEAKPDQLFAVGNLSEWDKHHKRILIGDLDIQRGDENESASLFTGEEELFAFERVISRLSEMQTEDYWQRREVLKSSGNRTSKKL